jgi:glutamate racemase
MMKHPASDNEHDPGRVHPARDAERSEQTIDHEYNRGDPRGPLQAYRTYNLATDQAQDIDSHLTYANAPIGVFDSGVGGLTILKDLRQEMPHEKYVYFGDTANCPYGTHSEAELIELSINVSRFLISQGVKLIVVACNTASQAALSSLRATFSIPFVGVVPAIKPASRATRSGRIGVAATNQAAQAAYLRQLIDDFAQGIQVQTIGCPELVTLVENGELDGPYVEEQLRHSLRPLLVNHIDVLVLGCTHFPALRPVIERIVGKHIQVIDSGPAIAHRTRAVLQSEGITRPVDASILPGDSLRVWCSGDPAAFSDVASKVLGYPIVACQATL